MTKTAQKPAAQTKPTPAIPKAESIKPEQLPVDLGGGEIKFVKRSDYAKRTAETLSMKYKSEVKRDHVTQCLEAIDKGQKELPGEGNPEELVKLFNVVLEDYEAGVVEVQRLAEEAAAAKLKKEQEEKEKAEKEQRLFAQMSEKNPNLLDLSSKFDLGNMDRFVAKADVSDEDLVGALSTGLKMGDFNGWMVGDIVVELEKRGLLNVVNMMAEKSGQSYANVYNNAKTCRMIQPDQRRKGVSFTLYRELATAKFTDEQKTKAVPALIDAVNEGKHNSQTVREEVRKIQGKKAPEAVAPEDDDKKEFILIDTGLDDPKQQVTVASGFPRELLGGGVLIIDPKTLKVFTSLGRKPENRWEEVGPYIKPEEKAAIEAAKEKKNNKKKK
jgi:hypothetical protein